MSEGARTFPAAVTGVPTEDPHATALAANWAMGRRNANQHVLVYTDSTTELESIPAMRELLHTPRVVPARWGAPIAFPSAVLAMAPTSTRLGALAADPHTVALCVVPSDLDDVAAWAVGSGAARLGTAASLLPGSDGRLAHDPILLHAMQTLDRQVSHATQLALGPDRDAATGMLTLMHDSGHWATPDELFAWALLSAWPMRSARRLRTIAAVIASGAQVEPKDGSVGHEILTTWRERDPFETNGLFDVPGRDGGAGTV